MIHVASRDSFIKIIQVTVLNVATQNKTVPALVTMSFLQLAYTMTVFCFLEYTNVWNPMVTWQVMSSVDGGLQSTHQPKQSSWRRR